MADPSDLLIDRTLVLFRHAKAVPPESGPDHERRLAKRGRRDATAAGGWLADQGLTADLVLCSTSVRTRETWEYAAAAGAEAGDVWFDRRIYNSHSDMLLEVVREAPATARTVLLIGHAPGVPTLAEDLVDPADESPAKRELMQKFPTSGLAVLRHTSRWASLSPGDAELVDFVVPRG